MVSIDAAKDFDTPMKDHAPLEINTELQSENSNILGKR
jgi:hypothetical protein